MNILHLALACDNSHYKSIENAAKETWMQRSPENVKTILMYGNSNKIYWNSTDSFYVDKPESLNICFYKTICAYETFIESNFDYIFRSNITGYFDLYKLVDFLEDKPRNKFYCGCLGELDGIYFSSGSGYFISKDLVVDIVKNKKILYDYNLPGYFDDVIIGKFLTQDLKIEINQKSRRLDIKPGEILNDLDMSHYHYRILDGGDVNSLYFIHKLKCKSQ